MRRGTGNRERGTVRPETLLLLRLQPNARRTELAGMHGEAMKIRVAAPPVNGAANEELIRFLAEHLGVPRSAVAIVGGVTSRTKRVRIAGVTAAEAAARLT